MLLVERSGTTLALSGGLTIYHACEARARLLAEMAAGPPLELDLSGIEELDTAGAQVLLWAKREAAGEGWALPFLRHSRAVLDVLELMNLAGILGDTLLLDPAP